VRILYPKVELAERAYEAESLRLPPEALGRRTVFLAGSEAGDFKGCWALRFYENCAGQTSSTIPYNALETDSSALSSPPGRREPREKTFPLAAPDSRNQPTESS
jgi:hypothetical protein